MVTASNEERIARLEAAYEHMATKEDLAEMESRILTAILNGQSETNRRIDETNRLIDEMNRLIDDTNQRISDTNQRIDDTNQRVDRTSEASNARIDRVFWAVLGIGGALLTAVVAALLRDALG